FSKSIDNWADEGNGTDAASVVDWYNTRLNRGLADFDHPHSLNASFIYTLPVGNGRRFLGSAPRLVDSLLGGWDLGGLNFWQSGSTYTVASGRATGPSSSAAWADFSGDRNIGNFEKRGNGVFLFGDDVKARFTQPQAGSIGSSGRNAFRGPQFFNIDATLS